MVIDEDQVVKLVGQARSGRHDAFAQLVGLYQSYAYGTAIGILNDFEMAQDVVQDALLCAYRDLSKLEDPARFGGWLYGIVKNTARRAMREQRRLNKLTRTLNDQSPERYALPMVDLERDEQRHQVRAALARLNEVNREALSMHYISGLSYTDIATYLGVTEATVLGRLQRGREALRKEMIMVVNNLPCEQLPDDFGQAVRQLLEAAESAGADRHAYITRLADLGEDAVEPLCSALADQRKVIRKAAAAALCRIGDPRALRPVMRLLYTNDHWVSHHLLKSGSILQIPGMRDELLRLIDEGSTNERYDAIQALRHAKGDPQVIARLERIFREVELTTGRGWGAGRALCELQPERTDEIVHEALEAGVGLAANGWIWWKAIREDLPIAMVHCLAAMQHTHQPGHRRFAGEVMLKHPSGGRAKLEQLMQTDSAHLRAAAALTLSRFGDPVAFEVLIHDMQHGGGGRKWQQMVTRSLCVNYRDHLLAWATEQPAEVLNHNAIAWVLAKARMSNPQPEKQELTWEGQPAARAAALRTMTQQRGIAAIPDLRRCLTERHPSKVVREACHQFKRLGEAAEAALFEMLESPHWGERKCAASILFGRGRLNDAQTQQLQNDEHVAVRKVVEE